ncbi:Histidine transport system permease protein HisM [Halomonadaceae bacterium LMG 33818]|uniref:ABC transporter permease n=1 Tax=Cernens ardua TaxID=3402176 RepID=UPI003EDBE1F7
MDALLTHIAHYLNGNEIFTVSTLNMYWHGFVTTVQLTFLALVTGIVIAVPLSILRGSRCRWIKWPVFGYTYLFRATPLLIQLYIAYYGFTFVPGVKNSIFSFFYYNPFYSCWLAFALNTAAYTTEIFHGAIKATPRGEVEAARAFGMSRLTQLRRIILPSAFRRALPAYGNEVIFMLHATVVAMAVTVTDLTGAAYYVYARFYAPFPAFLFVAALYMILSFSIQAAFRQLEKRMLIHLRPAQ